MIDIDVRIIIIMLTIEVDGVSLNCEHSFKKGCTYKVFSQWQLTKLY